MSTQLHQISKLSIVCVLLAALAGCPSERAAQTSTALSESAEAHASADSTVSNKQSAADQQEQAGEDGTAYQFIAPNLTMDEVRDGWISLFDGSTLFGWNVPEAANWRVEDGVIVADSGDVCLLKTRFDFDDFEFRCDFHLEQGGNSGVFLRTAEDCSNPAKDTYELNICDSHATHGTGSLVGRHVAQGVPNVEGDWHTFHVTCDGPTLQVILDGQSIVDFTDDSSRPRTTGCIGLQMNKGRIAFRNVFLKPLHSQELFNGKDLSGFRTVPGGGCEFTARDGVIHAENGPGFLETEDTFADFILHVEANIADEMAIADGRPANSGVFFRAIAGTEKAPSHGYEMQIQHDFKDGDRTQPLDFGSGGIYRRQPARYVVANNNEWFVETLIAQGDRFATFVNGYQVLDWQDTREVNANPRKGLRLKAGHLSLQGHDPTTNLDFRRLCIRELTN